MVAKGQMLNPFPIKRWGPGGESLKFKMSRYLFILFKLLLEFY